MPEVNPTGGKVLVLKGKNFKGLEGSKFDGKIYDGLYVLAAVERRLYKLDPNSEHITLTQYNSNTLILKTPTWAYDLLHETEEVEDLVNNHKVEQELLDALNNGQADMFKPAGELRKTVNLKMEFKSPIKLSGEVLHMGFDDTLVFPIEGTIKFQSGQSFFYWKVARVDTESFKKGRPNQQSTRSKGASLFDDDSPVRNETGATGMNTS